MKDFCEMFSAIKSFQVQLNNDPHGRFRSWEHCYNAFATARKRWREDGSLPDYDSLSLHLAFYLASWGMYRGSSFLLQKDYLVHERAVEIILERQYDVLHGIELFAAKDDLVGGESLIMGVYRRLVQYYRGVKKSIPEFADLKYDAISNTLITKILLGTLGCVPAYDRYFCDGLGKLNLQKAFSEKSLIQLIDYVSASKVEFESFRRCKNMQMVGGGVYPPMKLIDMAFWKLGFGNEIAH